MFTECTEMFISTNVNEENINVKPKGKVELPKFSCSNIMAVLEDNAWQLGRMGLKIYLLLMFEPLHIFHLGILELLNKAVVICLGSGKLIGGKVNKKIAFGILGDRKRAYSIVVFHP